MKRLDTTELAIAFLASADADRDVSMGGSLAYEDRCSLPIIAAHLRAYQRAYRVARQAAEQGAGFAATQRQAEMILAWQGAGEA